MIDLVTDLVGEWVEPASYDTRRATWSVGDPVLVRAAFVGENGEPKLIVESSVGDRPGSLFIIHIDSASRHDRDERWVRPVVKCAKCGKWGHRQHDQLSPLHGTPGHWIHFTCEYPP